MLLLFLSLEFICYHFLLDEHPFILCRRCSFVSNWKYINWNRKKERNDDHLSELYNKMYYNFQNVFELETWFCLKKTGGAFESDCIYTYDLISHFDQMRDPKRPTLFYRIKAICKLKIDKGTITKRKFECILFRFTNYPYIILKRLWLNFRLTSIEFLFFFIF